jgi:hypothetical protein
MWYTCVLLLAPPLGFISSAVGLALDRLKGFALGGFALSSAALIVVGLLLIGVRLF